ncbi:MAG: BlaI/MecI/CopY family transcriptional regulator [Peptococcaceae bacterium]|jgi:BlaI family penicillinase repressor|nr:BlaI/MecI/CopY family transcriptional regulator [Peptococcaceae bacterium]
MSKKIANSELEIMRILWREDRPVTFTEIRKELEDRTGWSKSTIYTLVLRLRKKGIISTASQHVSQPRSQTVMLFTPTIGEQEYLQNAGQNLLDRLFDGSTKSLLTTLHQNKKLDKDTIDELRTYFEDQLNSYAETEEDEE